MALALKVPKSEAQKWKDYLLKFDLFEKDYKLIKDDNFLFYPIKKQFHIIKGNVSFVEKDFENLKPEKGTLKQNLKSKLSEKDFEFLQTAHDIIGTIAILEIPEELVKHEILIAETLLNTNPNIKTVLKKAASHEGVFRTQKMVYLAGEKTKETIYKENNVRLKLNVETVYFSIRLSNERKRIAEEINEAYKKTKKKEQILVMFSGCGVYPIVISKNANSKRILGIEINPSGHKYGLENLKLNRIKNVNLIRGDVRKVISRLKKHIPKLYFDRIIMPLPKQAQDFLDVALQVARKGTIIHLYQFINEHEISNREIEIEQICNKIGVECKFLGSVRCGQHAPHIFRFCIDFQITKI